MLRSEHFLCFPGDHLTTSTNHLPPLIFISLLFAYLLIRVLKYLQLLVSRLSCALSQSCVFCVNSVSIFLLFYLINRGSGVSAQSIAWTAFPFHSAVCFIQHAPTPTQYVHTIHLVLFNSGPINAVVHFVSFFISIERKLN